MKAVKPVLKTSVKRPGAAPTIRLPKAKPDPTLGARVQAPKALKVGRKR